MKMLFVFVMTVIMLVFVAITQGCVKEKLQFEPVVCFGDDCQRTGMIFDNFLECSDVVHAAVAHLRQSQGAVYDQLKAKMYCEEAKNDR